LSEYPNLEDVEIDGKYLDMGKISQSGLTKLEVSACPKLTNFSCYRNNKFISLTLNCPDLQEIDCSDNQLAQIKLPRGEKLEKLHLDINNFHQDLSFLKDLVNLKVLYLGNNKFTGSLEILKDLNKLERFGISDTDIDSGLEYLPESLEYFYCKENKLTKELEVYGEPNDDNYLNLLQS
jgi:Leucine-rich repeat (LRR) protein